MGTSWGRYYDLVRVGERESSASLDYLEWDTALGLKRNKAVGEE